MRLLHLPCFAAQYHRLMAPDPPDHPARPPCTICTLKNWWSNAPPHTTAPVKAGAARAGPRPVRLCRVKGGDG